MLVKNAALDLLVRGDDDAKAVFEALCRVHGSAAGKHGPTAAILRFLSEYKRDGASAGADETGELPDFSESAAGPPPAPPSDHEGPHARDASARERVVGALLRTLSSYQGLLERYSRDFDEALARRPDAPDEEADETIRRLRTAQAILIKYPVAAQSAFAALVREGRRFATTEAGAEWKRRLASSPLIAKVCTMFEGVAAGVVA